MTPARGFVYHLIRPIVSLMACSFLLAHVAWGASKTPDSTPAVCAYEPTFDGRSDVQGIIFYKKAIQQLLAQEKFTELDCIADAERASKARFAGGRWKLNVFYWSLEQPEGHATEEDWSTHLGILNHWASANPLSITARVALAGAYARYAWDARGSDYADTVTQSGWKLFGQRIDKAKEILEQASTLEAKCPHWYVVMQRVALAEGWDLARATALLDQAVATEPDYYYYYREYVNYLKPQWNGKAGDAERFATRAADRVGGVKGDILYFQLATELICRCGDADLKLISWPRIKMGVAELEKRNGRSDTNLNLLAYMAVRERDGVVALNAFSRLGADWDRGVWKTEPYFNSSRNWAKETAGYQQTSGVGMVQQVRLNFADVFEGCARAERGDSAKFALVFSLQKDGVVNSVFSDPQTKVGLCLVKLKGRKLPPPPYAPFGFKMDIDPAEFRAASARKTP
jgi:hypothetical protein